MQIGVLTEVAPHEKRVALTPESIGRLVAAGHRVAVQSGAGLGAFETDDAYWAAGAIVSRSADDVLGTQTS